MAYIPYICLFLPLHGYHFQVRSLPQLLKLSPSLVNKKLSYYVEGAVTVTVVNSIYFPFNVLSLTIVLAA
jgi:hypothetical protein